MFLLEKGRKMKIWVRDVRGGNMYLFTAQVESVYVRDR